jgi:hypothetical protein
MKASGLNNGGKDEGEFIIMTASPAPWTIGAIPIATPDGKILIPGWENGVFGIDWRPQSPEGMAYVITHLGTGYSMFAMLADLEFVQDIADRLTSSFVWPSSSHVEDMRAAIDVQRPAIRAFRDAEGLDDPSLCLPPPGEHLKRS